MKIYYYCISFIALVFIIVFIVIYNKEENKLLNNYPFVVETESDSTGEVVYGYWTDSLKVKEITISDLNKILDSIRRYIVFDTKPHKSGPWICIVLHKTNHKKIYIYLLLRDNSIMVKVEKKSWLIPRKNKKQFIKELKSILPSEVFPLSSCTEGHSYKVLFLTTVPYHTVSPTSAARTRREGAMAPSGLSVCGLGNITCHIN